MSKKHEHYKPQKRHRLKKTVNYLQTVDVVYLDRERIDGVEQVYAICTCGEWRSSPSATTIAKVGLEAKKHVQDSSTCALRQHDADASHPLDDLVNAEITPEADI